MIVPYGLLLTSAIFKKEVFFYIRLEHAGLAIYHYHSAVLGCN